jgi:hypothetical protein
MHANALCIAMCGAVWGVCGRDTPVFCCVGALAIVDALEHVDADLLGWWLCERQLPNGGLNGRPEKLEDVCYSWWCLSSLAILRRLHWIDGAALSAFILRCQDTDTGGIADRPGNYVDVFHTLFGIAGASLVVFAFVCVRMDVCSLYVCAWRCLCHCSCDCVYMCARLACIARGGGLSGPGGWVWSRLGTPGARWPAGGQPSVLHAPEHDGSHGPRPLPPG